MALFGTNEEKVSKKKAAPKKVKPSETDATLAYRVLVKPCVTEKSHAALGLNKYVFKVAPTATKTLVKQAVEKAYSVTVEKVNMVTIPAKRRFFGRSAGMKSSVKKATVTLREGDSIELFQSA